MEGREIEPWDFGTECVVCGNPVVDMHHIFPGTSNRAQSERYGYKIPLCRKHHTDHGVGIHFNRGMALAWQQKAQHHFERNYGTREDFIKTFGRSFL